MTKHYHWKIGEPLPQLGGHSVAKHQVFARYIDRYIQILSSMPQRRELNLTLVDGFCGGGAVSLRRGPPFLIWA